MHVVEQQESADDGRDDICLIFILILMFLGVKAMLKKNPKTHLIFFPPHIYPPHSPTHTSHPPTLTCLLCNTK